MHNQGFLFRDYNNGWLTYMQNTVRSVLDYIEPYLAKNGGNFTHRTRFNDHINQFVWTQTLTAFTLCVYVRSDHTDAD